MPSVVLDSAYFQGKWGGFLMDKIFELPIAINISGDSILIDIPNKGVSREYVADATYHDAVLEIRHDSRSYQIQLESLKEMTLELRGDDGEKGTATLLRGQDRPRLKRSQENFTAEGYSSQAIVVENTADSVTLQGTLTQPLDSKAAVILLSGSGPSDRDQTIFNHKPFAVLAHYLSSHGVAVIRYDDRGVGDSSGSQIGSTTADFAKDAASLYRYAKDNLGDIPVGFIGHSEGGMIAQITDSLVAGADFHIYLASPGMDVVDMMIEQNRQFLTPMIGPEQAKIYSRGLNSIFSIVVSSLSTDAKKAKIDYAAKALYNRLDSAAAKKIAPSDFFYAMNMNALQHNDWMVYFLAYQPRQYLSQIKCPILALNGSKDIQVVPENLLAIQRDAAQSEVTAVMMPDLNRAVNEYALISETINPVVLETILTWMFQKGWSHPYQF